MLKSNKAYNLNSNSSNSLKSKIFKAFVAVLMILSIAGAPIALTSCNESETAIVDALPSITQQEMDEFVVEYFKTPIIGNLSNPSSIAYSIDAENGVLYKISIISTSTNRDGTSSAYFTELDYGNGLTQKEIENKENVYNSSFSNFVVESGKTLDEIDLQKLYNKHLGKDYIVAKINTKVVEDEKGIEI